jgi:NAD(P)-dependent dehydrogenase (short-subunit alcohol dehydrogenase family)
MTFEHQVIMITGAAGNLGQALVEGLQGSGARLALFDHRQNRLSETYPQLETGDRILFVNQVDVTDEDAIGGSVDRVLDHFGRVDVLINAAGGYSGGQALDETSIETWDRMIDLNARSVFLVSRAVLPGMRDQGGGVIVNIGARPGLKGRKNATAYSASKGAVLRLTESISAEVHRDGIRVNAVIPGTIDTPENREAMPDANHERWVKPSAVADVILFLASDQASEISGASVPVYGSS